MFDKLILLLEMETLITFIQISLKCIIPIAVCDVLGMGLSHAIAYMWK